jgi:hypothetical protein
MKEGIIKDTYEAIIKEIQTIITITYIAAIGIGMLFNYQKYSEFGINIFDYADVFDFLIAPFSDFYVFWFTIVSILLSIIIIRIDLEISRKYPKFYSKISFGWDRKSWFGIYRYSSFGIIVIMYLYLSADIYGSFIKKQIHNQSPIEIRYTDNEIITGILIGKTGEILFLLEHGKVKAIPIMALVKEIELN